MAKKKLFIASAVITVGELATQLNLPVTRLISELFKNGIVATVNQWLDLETAQIIIDELNLDVELEKSSAADSALASKHDRVYDDTATKRPPVVAVMGHVDHGKTSLMDVILDAKVASGEAGGITQHISAHQTIYKGLPITLLDTPGHEAFSALRQHGAALTDIVIIVVAADDGVKPQTIEAIKFARQAHAKIVVAINKMDKPGADSNRVKQQLATEHELTPEEWGGNTVMVEVSAKTKEGIDKLLDMVLLVSDLEDLKASDTDAAEGLVIEARMQQGQGVVVSLLVENGILTPGSYLVAGGTYGKVRTLLDDMGKPLAKAGPSRPATVIGFKKLPKFGERFVAFSNEKQARQKSEQYSMQHREEVSSQNMSSSELLDIMTKRKEKQSVNIVLKADVQGSLTSVADSLRMLENDELSMKVVGSGVGDVTENDIRLAAGSHAIIYGFNVQLPPAVKRLAQREKVTIRIFSIIYELIDDAVSVLNELLSPELVEKELGELVVKGVFRTTKNEIVCGGQVTKGKVQPGVLIRIWRGKEQLSEADVISVQRQQQEVKEVFEGEMCGLQLKTKTKLLMEEGDRIEFFTREFIKRTL
ncbi:MAG TPA: translation initiation factor IF-2 [Patescibacteria group bacterium]|jgi:translation initiation factor IF-2|nr:translation initiation factor IF-2 [Patescibacteria group bacterium]